MCWVCVSNPFEHALKDQFPEAEKFLGRKFDEAQRKKFHISFVKSIIEIIEKDTEGKYCPEGQIQMDKIRELQYNLSREL